MTQYPHPVLLPLANVRDAIQYLLSALCYLTHPRPGQAVKGQLGSLMLQPELDDAVVGRRIAMTFRSWREFLNGSRRT